jgi:RNA polymerase sigma-70 factor, ECF subfamily
VHTRIFRNFFAAPRQLRVETETGLTEHPIDEAQLLSRTQSGDERAFEILYARHQPRVFRYALRMSGSETFAEEVVQEVFLALIHGARGYDPHSGPLRSYLYGMARHALARQRRDDWRFEDLDGDAYTLDGDPLEGLTRDQAVVRLRHALAALPTHYREAVVFCEMEELSYAETAEILGVPIGTVRSRLNRARALLLDRLSRQGVEV